MTWQPKLGAAGERVEGIGELEQSLKIVLRTPMGSVAGRPTFGSRVLELIDLPINEARPKIVREVFRAVSVSEPRITVLDVTPTVNADGRVTPKVRWKPTDPTDTREAIVRETTVDL